MRHNKKINHLGRTDSHRKAMLSNMAASLILHKKIVTTLAKAKALRIYVEPLITKSKKDDVHSRRTVFSYLQNKVAVKELFMVVANKIADRPGGYTRILKTGNRLGDNAEMCLIELVDFNEALLKEKQTKKTKSTRRSRSKKAKDDETDTTVAKKTTRKKSTEDIKKDETIDEVNQSVDINTNDVVETTEDVTSETQDNSDEEENKQEDIKPEEDNTEEEKK